MNVMPTVEHSETGESAQSLVGIVTHVHAVSNGAWVNLTQAPLNTVCW